MFDAVKQSAARAARKTALSVGALIALCVGIGFLTAAGWIHLSLAHGPLTAALVIGLIYVGIGLVLIAVAGSSAPETVDSPSAGAHAAEPDPETPNSLPPLAQAFVYGLNAGVKAKRR